MSKQLKPVASITIIYQGLEVQVPVDTKYVWIHPAKNGKQFVAASAEEPTWDQRKGRYTGVAYETVQQVEGPFTLQEIKASLETEDAPVQQTESTTGAQLLQQAVTAVEKGSDKILSETVRLLHGMAKSIEKGVIDAKTKGIPLYTAVAAVHFSNEDRESAMQAMLSELAEHVQSLDEALEAEVQELGFESIEAVYQAAGYDKDEDCDCPACSAKNNLSGIIPAEVLQALSSIFNSK